MAEPVLLSGENPQIAKGYGETPVAAYIAAVPGWKQAICKLIDQMISQQVPGVCKAVKWNSPFYGTSKDCWFLSFHCHTTYVKVRFHNGKQLQPMPPIDSPQGQTRYLKIYENDSVGNQFADWVRQAAALPGERL